MATEEEAAAVAERITAERVWPYTVKLAHPIAFGGEMIATLTFRRGKMGDLKGMKIDGVPSIDQLLMIASRMSAQPVAALEMLEDEDGAQVLEIALSFFARCLGGGQTR